MKPVHTIILGAAGRDFHNFNVHFRKNKNYVVDCFTAEQIPFIEKRKYPASLAGRRYPRGIPIYLEKKLPELVKKYRTELIILAYSDLSNNTVMEKAYNALSLGCDFALLGPENTQLKSRKKVVSVCAARTGSGKSQTSKKIAQALKEGGKRVVVVRHPMPYGDLQQQSVQLFRRFRDLSKNQCTIEEREEYEPYIELGIPLMAGVDYERILRRAEKMADVIVWDGGNNDFSFYKPDLEIVVVDPHRAGNELTYYPGAVNTRTADVVIVNKVDTARKESIALVERNVRKVNPKARILRAESPVRIEGDWNIRGMRVLCVEDGPTVTHGGMAFGAAYLAARQHGARIVDPRKHAVGSIKKTFQKFPHLKLVLPAMGYSNQQVNELQETINKTPCEVVLDGSPGNISRMVKTNKIIIRVRYALKERGWNMKALLKQYGVL